METQLQGNRTSCKKGVTQVEKWPDRKLSSLGHVRWLISTKQTSLIHFTQEKESKLESEDLA